MREMFGPANANWSRDEDDMIEIVVDSCTATLDPSTLVSVVSGHKGLALIQRWPLLRGLYTDCSYCSWPFFRGGC